MTPASPSSSEGSSLPPRHRPNKSDFIKETTELDLWAFDELDEIEAERAPGISAAPDVIPSVPRTAEKPKKEIAEVTEDVKQEKEEKILLNVSKERPKPRGSVAPVTDVKSLDDFDDLADWEDALEGIDLPAVVATEEVPAVVAKEEVPVEPEPVKEVVPEVAAAVDEFSPSPAPVGKVAAVAPLKLRLGLSKIERVALIGMGLLMLGGAVALVVSLKKLPNRTVFAEAGDFPIRGALMKVDGAVTYWRAPISEGEGRDTYRMGTVLLPVIEVQVSSGAGAVRGVFRNQDGETMGDVVTRAAAAGKAVVMAATAGFDDLGMHSAYRTGSSRPWTVEVLEGPSTNAASGEFKKLFEINISTDRR